MKIVVTGSLGNVSKPLAKTLIEKGHVVTIISSNPEKQKDIEATGAIAAIGSVENIDFLLQTFTGADALYAMVPPSFTAPDTRAYYQRIARSYATAITKSGIKRVVHLSSWGADLDKGTGVILGSHDVEGILNALPGIALTHLRATSFYTNFYSYVNMIKGMNVMGTNYGGDDKLTMVHYTDIAAAAAEEIETHATGVHIRYVASDEHTANEIAAILGAAIGKPDLKWITFTDEQTRSSLEKNGVPPLLAANLVELGASIHSGTLRSNYDLHKPTTMGKVKLEDFAKEFAAAFK